MTFIASVIAKRGVAIIADSLVTSEKKILHYDKFIKYLNADADSLNTEMLKSLFEFEPAHTKDYEDKLFRLNHYTAITTTGAAHINGKNISDIIHEFIMHQSDLENFNIPFRTKLQQLSNFLNIQVTEHLAKYSKMDYCVFMITFYEIATYKVHIYKAVIAEVLSGAIANSDFNFVTLNQEADWIKVVSDGQNKISDSVLYGFGKTFYNRFPSIVATIVDKLKLAEGVVPPDFLKTLEDDPILNQMFYGDIEMLNLSELSLPQAVDLASLLMRLEVDFQKYTKDMPTVGGVIKLAVIDEKEGFRFILGDKIEPPKYIHL
jgi:hypothetical protein